MTPVPCYYCGKEATLLCDGVLAMLGTQDGPRMVYVTKDPKTYTCDRPLCWGCVEGSYSLFFSGKDGGIEGRDFCPQCVQEGRLEAVTGMIVTAEDGERIQRERNLYPKGLAVIRVTLSGGPLDGKAVDLPYMHYTSRWPVSVPDPDGSPAFFHYYPIRKGDGFRWTCEEPAASARTA